MSFGPLILDSAVAAHAVGLQRAPGLRCAAGNWCLVQPAQHLQVILPAAPPNLPARPHSPARTSPWRSHCPVALQPSLAGAAACRLAPTGGRSGICACPAAGRRGKLLHRASPSHNLPRALTSVVSWLLCFAARARQRGRAGTGPLRGREAHVPRQHNPAGLVGLAHRSLRNQRCRARGLSSSVFDPPLPLWRDPCGCGAAVAARAHAELAALTLGADAHNSACLPPEHRCALQKPAAAGRSSPARLLPPGLSPGPALPAELCRPLGPHIAQPGLQPVQRGRPNGRAVRRGRARAGEGCRHAHATAPRVWGGVVGLGFGGDGNPARCVA